MIGEVLESFKKEFIGVCKVCFSADISAKYVDFVEEYKVSYECELNLEESIFLMMVVEFMVKFKVWK